MDAYKAPSIGAAAALAALALLCAPAASAAVTTVYKCFDRNLNVVYTDQPCRGEQLDIEAGRADPTAIAELQREREALSRAVAQRIADNRRYPVAPADYMVAPPLPAQPEVYYPAGGGYYAPYGDNRVRGRGNHAGGGDNQRGRAARAVAAVPPNGITNRTFR
jgi:hypothetical protein